MNEASPNTLGAFRSTGRRARNSTSHLAGTSLQLDNYARFKSVVKARLNRYKVASDPYITHINLMARVYKAVEQFAVRHYGAIKKGAVTTKDIKDVMKKVSVPRTVEMSNLEVATRRGLWSLRLTLESTLDELPGAPSIQLEMMADTTQPVSGSIYLIVTLGFADEPADYWSRQATHVRLDTEFSVDRIYDNIPTQPRIKRSMKVDREVFRQETRGHSVIRVPATFLNQPMSNKQTRHLVHLLQVTKRLGFPRPRGKLWLTLDSFT